jgi:hypothetical protein
MPGPDFPERFSADKPGGFVVIAGNNKRKSEFIARGVEAGMHVLADKPMAINGPGFDALVRAFADARDRGVLLYDIMTERFEITTMLQKAFSRIPEVFGELLHGSLAEPAIVKESVTTFRSSCRERRSSGPPGSSTSSSRAKAWSTSRRISSISSNGSASPARASISPGTSRCWLRSAGRRESRRRSSSA